VRALPQPLRYVLLAAGFFALAVAGTVLGTVASAHHVSGLSNLAAALVGIALALVIGMSRMASYTEMTLELPGYYKGENVCVISLQAHGTNVEVAAPAQLLEILRYSLARTAVGAP
jgi:hypothetical protein